MSIVREYTQTLLMPELRVLGLSKRQTEIVSFDIAERLASILSHWADEHFRRTVLVLGTEEASFWEPRSASLEIRALVVVAVRNSLLTDLNADRAYTKELRSRRQLLPDRLMPSITSRAIKYFDGIDLSTTRVEAETDQFGSFSTRYPNAWHVLSLLGNSSEAEITCTLPMAEAEPMPLSTGKRDVQSRTVVESGIDPRWGGQLSSILRKIQQRDLDLFMTFALKGVTRNPKKLLGIIDLVLRHGATMLTPNYLLSPTYLARRNPLLRPAHFMSEMDAQVSNPEGLSDRHRELLMSLVRSPTGSGG